MSRRPTAFVAAFILTTWCTAAQAQMQVTRIDDPPRIAAYWELGGSAVFSGNVDVLVADHTSLRAGGLLALMSDDPDIPWNALFTVNRLFGANGHYLEVGAGVVAMHRLGFEGRGTAAGTTASIGFRLQTRHQFMRIAVSAAPPRLSGPRASPVMGLSWGRTF
jgi:hypothetical protein